MVRPDGENRRARRDSRPLKAARQRRRDKERIEHNV